MRGRDIMLRHRLSLLTLALAAVVTGCGVAPTAPSGVDPAAGGTQSGGSELLAMSQDGRAWFTTVATDTDSVTADYTLSTGDGSRLLETTAEVDGAVGGVLTCGRFTLAVPPKAFEGTAKIHITVPDSALALCDVGIDPPELNRFDVPVRLSLGLDGLNVSAALVSILWWDPVAKQWVDTGSEKNLLERSVTSNLSHFSTYAGGKAGW